MIWFRVLFCVGLVLSGMWAGASIHAGIVAKRDLKAIGVAERDKLRRMDRGDAAAVKHEQYKAAVEVRERIVRVKVDRVVEQAVYRNVCLDDDGLKILADDVNSRALPSSGAFAPAPAPSASHPATSGE